MSEEYRYDLFVKSANYALFKFILEDQIKEYFERLKRSNDKEEVWQIKKSIETLTRFQSTIEETALEVKQKGNLNDNSEQEP